jgi:uncharacterized spore protein YtfJ
MSRRRLSFSAQTIAAPEVVCGAIRVTPRAQVCIVRLPFGGLVWSRPKDVQIAAEGHVRRIRMGSWKGEQLMIDTVDGVVSAAEQAQQQSVEVFDKILAAAQPSAVFSQPVVAGAYTVITASEVFAGGGFGFGAGTGPASQPHTNENHSALDTAAGSGGGGGGGSHGRPVATIIIGPDGVKVQPIADATKIALAVIGAWAGVTIFVMRLARARKGAKV